MSSSSILDYAVLPLIISGTSSFPEQTTHTLYVRPHAPKIPTTDSSRSLFLVNVPTDSTVSHLRAVFTSILGAGKFEDCTFENERKATPSTATFLAKNTASNGKKRKRGAEEGATFETVDLPQTWDRELRCSGSTAVILLVDEKCVEVAMKTIQKLHRQASKSKFTKNADRESIWPIWGLNITEPSPLGSHRYSTHHKLRFPDQNLLLANIDAFMSSWNANEEAKNNERRNQRNFVDEDGFMTVTRGGRTGPSRMEDAERKRAELEERERRKRDGMGDFYRFQTREARKERAGELVRAFEGDRERVRRLKEGRKGGFRPE